MEKEKPSARGVSLAANTLGESSERGRKHANAGAGVIARSP